MRGLGYITDTRVINSRPMPYPLWYPSHSYTDILVSRPPRVLDFRARTHGNSWQDEGRIVRENTRVVAGKILFRFPSCPATYRGKRARYSILPEIRLIYRLLLSITILANYVYVEQSTEYLILVGWILWTEIFISIFFRHLYISINFNYITRDYVTLGNNREYLSVLMSEKCVK